MTYNVKLVDSNLVLSSNSSEIFFQEFAKLPEGTYAIEILGDECRPVRKRRRRRITTRTANIISIICDIVTVNAWLLSCIAMWILLAYLG